MAHHPPPSWQSSEGLIVAAFRHGPLWNFSYLIACEETREAAVIDPAWDVPAILEAAEQRGLHISMALLSHNHSDHANGLRDLVAATEARALAHAGDERGLRPHFERAHTFQSGEAFELGDLALEALGSPGHTPGSVTFRIAGRIFTGDTLAVGSPGTPGPEAGALEALWESTTILRSLPAGTLIHPGHDSGVTPQANLAAELERNPALRATSLEEFRAAVERATGRAHR